jgi:nucleoside-diphosphate kinase
MAYQTFVMIKPDAIERGLASLIIEFFNLHNLRIVRQQTSIVQKETILSHYQEMLERVNKDYLYAACVEEFIHKEVILLVLESDRDDLIAYVRQIIGATDPAKALPDTIRGKYAEDTLQRSIDEKRMLRNLIHASDSPQAVEEEMKLWFGA